MLPKAIRQLVSVLGGLLVLGSAVRSMRGDGDVARVITPDELHWTAVSGYPSGYARAMLEGEADKAIPFTYRVRLPAHFRAQPHTHPSDEHVTVLQGAWSFGVGETFDASRLRTLPAGTFVIIPAGTPHFVATEGETIIQAHGIGPIRFQYVADPGRR